MEKEIEKLIYETNNTPQKRFAGISPYEMYELIHHPFGTKCPLKWVATINESILEEIPFFKVCESLLQILAREQAIKLTPLGALPKKTVVEIYAHKFITEPSIESGMYKLTREQNSRAIETAKLVCEIAKLTKKRTGKLSLTKKGEQLLEDRVALLKLLFETFAFDFNWGFHDIDVEEPIGQYGNLFTVYLLQKFGQASRDASFYFSYYHTVFSSFENLYESDYFQSAKEQFRSCYERRTFLFTNWMGLTKTVENKFGFLTKVEATHLPSTLFTFIPQKE